jgi:hypothetical protein
MNLKVISYSLWGDKDVYNIGALKNAESANLFFPDFECWFYIHKESVPTQTINSLLKHKNVKIFMREGDLDNPSILPMTWRFEAIDDPLVSIMMPRDTDTRFLLREQLAVRDWIFSGKKFHIMRDHPHHKYKILGGMFGTRKLDNFIWTEQLQRMKKDGDRNYDQDFLSEFVYPLIKNNVLIHSNFIHFDYEHCIEFPIDYDANLRFIGEYIYSDETRSEDHINILNRYLKDHYAY